MEQKIGIYPGTFDPIHKGHLTFALAAAEACQLDKVVFLPEYSPRGKVDVACLTERVEQIEAAVEKNDNLDLLVLLTRRFTYNSAMPEIRNALGETAHFTLLMGSDVAKSLAHGWEDAHKLFTECQLAVGLRGDDTAEDISNHLLQVPNIRGVILTTEHRHESSSRERDRN